MGAINENVYGLRENWISAPYYPDEIPDENRIMLANFGNDDSTIEKAMTENKLPLGATWDKTLSYAALGNNHPLANIKYYYYVHDDAEPKKLKVLNQDARMTTLYALGVDGSAGLTDVNVIIVDGDENSPNKAKFNRYTNGAEYDSTYSGYKSFKPFVQIPVKRCVLVPYVMAYYPDMSYGTTFDLDDYVTNRKDYYPKITQIRVTILTDRNDTYDPETGDGTPNRSAYDELCGGVVLDPLSYGNGYNYLDIPLNNIFRPIISRAIAGALFDKDLPANQTSSTWCVPVADGFGMTFDKINGNVDGAINDNNESRFYCDASELSADAIRESVRHMVACYGLFFADSLSDAQTKKLDDPAIMCGVLVDGIGNGDYTTGAQNRDNDMWNMDDAHDVDFDPLNPPILDPNTYDGSMHSGALAFSQTTQLYNISKTDFISLSRKLWDAMALVTPGDPINDYCLDTFLTTNPIDSIVSLKYFPIKENMAFGTATTVKLGKYDTSITCTGALPNITVDCGSKMIYPRFGNGVPNWLDKMTTITLYLPFCGTLQLDAEIYMGRTVNVEYAIDLNTGNCSAFVSFTADNGERCITDVANGNCGIDLPVTGLQHITLDSQLYNATEQLKAMRINNAVAGLTSLLGVAKTNTNDIGGAVSGILSTGAGLYNMLHSESVAEYNLQHTQLPIKMIGTTGATTGAMCEIYPVLIIERPDVSDVTNADFAAVNGYACCKSDLIKNFKGYTEFANADLSGFNATASEKNAIMSALKGGVIL